MTLAQAIEPPVAALPELPTPSRHDLNFDFQIVPPQLRDEQASDFDKLRYASLRFATVVDLLSFETGDLPNQTRQQMKARVNNFGLFLSNTKNGIRHGMLPAARRLFDHWTDNLAALGWNVLDHFFKAKDQRVFLHLIHLYSQGRITLPGCEKPLNECSFAEVVAAERDEERQHWVELQRQGIFLALTWEDLVPGAGATPLEELTLQDFKVARAALNKAQLIAYEAPDGRRVVFKDTLNAPETGVEDES